MLYYGLRYLCLTDHSVRYIVFHRVLVFLAAPMCYIPFERVFDVDLIETLSVRLCVRVSVRPSARVLPL